MTATITRIAQAAIRGTGHVITITHEPAQTDAAGPYVVRTSNGRATTFATEDEARACANGWWRELRTAPIAESVPAGRYALVENGTVKFYKVDRPTEGRWAGYVFLKQQAGDEFHKVFGTHRREYILEAIAADVRGATERYGRELGVCGVCGRTLTD